MYNTDTVPVPIQVRLKNTTNNSVPLFIFIYKTYNLSHFLSVLRTKSIVLICYYFICIFLCRKYIHQSVVINNIEYSVKFNGYCENVATADPKPDVVDFLQIDPKKLQVWLNYWQLNKAKKRNPLFRIITYPFGLSSNPNCFSFVDKIVLLATQN